MNTRARASTALAAAAVIALLGAGSGSGSSSTPITACGQIVTTNAVLTQNLFCAGSGVVVAAFRDHRRSGLGIAASGYTTGPLGANAARANDDPLDCWPASLC